MLVSNGDICKDKLGIVEQINDLMLMTWSEFSHYYYTTHEDCGNLGTHAQ